MMLPREHQPVSCICLAVYGVDRVTLERADSTATSPATFDVALAGIELPNANESRSQLSAPSAPPFYVLSRDWLRRQLVGNRVTFLPVTMRVGYLYACPDSNSCDCVIDDELMLNAQLVNLGLALARGSASSSHGSQRAGASEKRRVWFNNLEDAAREKGVGIHGLGRMLEAVRDVKRFPDAAHPYHTLLVHHLQFEEALKVCVESVVSPFLLTCVLSRSQQEIQVRLCGISASRSEFYFQQARALMIKAMLHRDILLTLHGFDHTTQTFWARVVSPHGAAVHAMLEEGLMSMDERSCALPTLFVESLTSSQAAARAQGRGIWSSSAPFALPPTVAQQETVFKVTGTVTAVFDESSFQVSCVSIDIEGTGLPKPAELFDVSLSRFVSRSPSPKTKVVEAGTIITYSPQSFYGREALRRLLIGGAVSVSGLLGNGLSSERRSSIIVASAVTLQGTRTVDVIRLLLARFPNWYHPHQISFGSASFPLVEGSRGVVPLSILLEELEPRTANSLSEDEETDDFVVLGSPSRAVGDVSTLAAPPPSALPIVEVGSSAVDILYVASAAQLQHLLQSQLLPLSSPLPCLVEEVRCKVDSISKKLLLSFAVYLTSVGMVVPVILEGIRLPLVMDIQEGEPKKVDALKTLELHCERMRAFLIALVLHREATVTLIRPSVPPRLHAHVGTPNQHALVYAILGTPSVPSIVHALVKNGFGVASGLLSQIPLKPAMALLSAQAEARSAESMLWSPGSKVLLHSMAKIRAQNTGIHRTPSTTLELHGAIHIVPLSFDDHRTFTYRLVSDALMLSDIEVAVRQAKSQSRKSHRFAVRVGDVVAAPYLDGDGFLRAKIVEIDTSASTCRVFYLDCGTTSPLSIPLDSIRTNYRGKNNLLDQWPPLARRARHAFLHISPQLCASTAEETYEGSTAAQEEHRHLPSSLHSRVRNCLMRKMEILVSFPQLAMYYAYEKDGVDHVLIKPAHEPLESTANVPFELAMWRELLALQVPQRSGAGGLKNHHPFVPRSFIVDIDRGCVEFPVLVEAVAPFWAVRAEYVAVSN